MVVTPLVIESRQERLRERRWLVVSALGVTQILAWGASYYLLAVLAEPISADTGWSTTWVVGGLSLGLLVAGLISPRMGDTIQRRGGRAVLAMSSVLLGFGLIGIAVSTHLVSYFLSWAVMGLGMGTGLYDAAFATLGRLYGAGARSLITALTLIAGFSSTLCWPALALLVDLYGWRVTCLTFAGTQLGVSAALHLIFVPDVPAATEIEGTKPPAMEATRQPGSDLIFWMLAATLTLLASISAIISVQIFAILHASGLDAASAVALAALLGPAQVAARFLEMSFGRHYHPVWTLMAATGLVTAGLALLLVNVASFAAAAVLFYGAGIGIAWVARGTVPLALFGAERYAARMGRLAFPSLIAQALSPWLGAVLVQEMGIASTLAVLLAAAMIAAAAAYLVTVRTLQDGISSD